MGNNSPAVRRFSRLAVAVGVLAIAGGIYLGVHHRKVAAAPSWTQPAPYIAPVARHRGGEVRVAVSTPPELVDPGLGGSTVRSLVLPHLFVARPDGAWTPSLVQPGSDGADADGRTAWFSLRPDVKWSNGSSISAADLRRTIDQRFVSAVDDANGDGRILVHLKFKLPDWRRLWSDDAGIAPPSVGVSGGPFVIQSVVSGDETVLARNPSWFQPAYLDDIKLDYVPDAVMARQLLAAGTLDVVAPVADTERTTQFQAMAGVSVARTAQGGAWTALLFNSTSANTTFAAVLDAFPRTQFVNALLAGEASTATGFVTGADTADSTGAKLNNASVTLTVPSEEPLSPLLGASLQRAVEAAGGKLQVRSTDYSTMSSLIAAKTFDLAFVTEPAEPQLCWTCLFGAVDPALAAKADSGSSAAVRALESKARNDGVMLPLWREQTMLAYRTQAVAGVTANGYAASSLADAANWYSP